MKHYPSWRYHKELAPKLIHSEKEESSEWKDSPADFEVLEPASESKEEVKEQKEVKKKSKN